MTKRPSIIEVCVAGLMLMLVALVFAQVVVRYMTYQPLAWSEEAARYIFIWLCLLGAVVAAQRGQHFVVDYAQRALPARWYRITATVTQLIAVGFYGLLAFTGFRMLQVVSLQQSPSLEIPMSLPYLAIPAGALLLSAVALHQAWSIWFATEE